MMTTRDANLVVLGLVLCTISLAEAFIILPQSAVSVLGLATRSCSTWSSLYSTPRKPRRSLQKRRKRNKNNGDTEYSFVNPAAEKDDFPWDTAESRPLIAADKIEAGEDYWIDEVDLKKQEERAKPPKRLEGQVTDEKLWGEVLSPYRQNWIGLFSVLVVALGVIVTQFPELLQSPTITIPDL